MLLAKDSALVAGSTVKRKDEMIVRVKVNRAFLYKGARQEVGRIVELPQSVAAETCALGKSEPVKDERPETVEESEPVTEEKKKSEGKKHDINKRKK